MDHRVSEADIEFGRQFECGEITPEQFDHGAHIRLAYLYLVTGTNEQAYDSMRHALHKFLDRYGIDDSKYHDTLTRAWLLAVRHFMEKTGNCSSASELIERNPQMLDSKIMLSHYSAGLLFSAKARAEFIDPDIEPIPRYRDRG